MSEIDVAEDMARHMVYAHCTGCICRLEWKSLGRLDRVHMGKGWVRMTTEPECPHHGGKS